MRGSYIFPCEKVRGLFLIKSEGFAHFLVRVCEYLRTLAVDGFVGSTMRGRKKFSPTLSH